MNYRTLLAGGLAAIVSCTSPESSYSQKTGPSPPATSTPQSAPTTFQYDQMLEIAVRYIPLKDKAFREFGLNLSKPLFKDPQYQSLKPILDKALNTPIGEQSSIIKQLKGRYFRIKYFISKPENKFKTIPTRNQDLCSPFEEFQLQLVYLFAKPSLMLLEEEALAKEKYGKDSKELRKQIKEKKDTFKELLEILETSDFVSKKDHEFIRNEKELYK